MSIARHARLHVVRTARAVGSVHFGGSFSVMEILAGYYAPVIEKRQTFAAFVDANTLILSKGHCGLAVYAMLTAIGVIPSEVLATYCKDGGAFIGHIKKNDALGIGWSTGSLGHGLSIAMGVAGAYKHLKLGRRVTCILGDGEMHEGSNWEALLHLSHDDRLPLTIILDNNQFLSLGRTQDIRPLEPIQRKMEDFQLDCLSVNGHDIPALEAAIARASTSARVLFINANTIKGYGVSFTAGITKWHAKRASEEELLRMESELTEPDA